MDVYPRTLAWQIARHARAAPEAPAILAPGRAPLAYAGLAQQISQTADDLARTGFGHRSRVALILRNGPEMAVALVSVMSCTTCVPLNPDAGDDTLRELCERTRVDAIVIADDAPPALHAMARALLYRDDRALPIGPGTRRNLHAALLFRASRHERALRKTRRCRAPVEHFGHDGPREARSPDAEGSFRLCAPSCRALRHRRARSGALRDPSFHGERHPAQFVAASCRRRQPDLRTGLRSRTHGRVADGVRTDVSFGEPGGASRPARRDRAPGRRAAPCAALHHVGDHGDRARTSSFAWRSASAYRSSRRTR